MLAIQTNKDAVTERPILFTGRMVRKILSGEKTNTRRIMNPQPVFDPAFSGGWIWKTKRADTAIASINDGIYPEACPWMPGSRLWVRESFVVGQRMKGWKPELDEQGDEKLPAVWYKADEQNADLLWTAESGETSFDVPWKPSIHMPRWACRLVLELVSVRVERLQDISEEDAKVEGVEIALGSCPDSGQPYRAAFAQLWDTINAERGPWESNPWIWALGFRRI